MTGRFLSEDNGATLYCDVCGQQVRSNEAHQCSGPPHVAEYVSGEDFDYTGNGRRPSAVRIVADWKRAGRPHRFSVTYGETYAEFSRNMAPGNFAHPWNDSGNGCRGVDRGAVVRALIAADAAHTKGR